MEERAQPNCERRARIRRSLDDGEDVLVEWQVLPFAVLLETDRLLELGQERDENTRVPGKPQCPCGLRSEQQLRELAHSVGAELAGVAMRRLRYPTNLRTYVTRLVRAHAFPLDHVDELFARRMLRAHGDELAFDLVAHKAADLRGKRVQRSELEAVSRLHDLLEQERVKPHRRADLAVDGSDLIALGYGEGPELGAALDALLDAVVDDPALNTRDRLLERARAQLQ
jgi:tRNA nucleotidyltransferase (CCA-adding enzyme)